MLRYFLLVLGIYVLYKLVFDIIVPVFRTSRLVHRQFQDIHQRMQEEMNPRQPGSPSKNDGPQQKKGPVTGDYIDYEEVK